MEILAQQNNNTAGQLPPPPAAGAAPGLPAAGLPVKRGRGRPKGSPNKPKRAGLDLPPGWKPPAPPAAPGEPAPAEPGLGAHGGAWTIHNLDDKPAGDSPTALWTEENARPFAELPFLAGAVITSFDGFLLDDKEAIGISKPLASVLNRYFPSGSEYADVSCLCATMLVIYGMKHKAYQEWLKKQEAQK